jgi:hypothetical protein
MTKETKDHPDSSAVQHDPNAGAKAPAKERRKRNWRRIFLSVLLIAIIAGVVARLMLPSFARWYVNRALDRNLLYEGRIGDITISLWRGAYSISDVRLIKTTGNVPEPFFKAKRVELAIQWSGILHRKAVGRVVMDEPQLNFVDAPDASESQSGAGGPWLQTLADLFPFKLNSVLIHHGSVHFRTYQKESPVDVYLGDLEGGVDDLTNIRDQTTPLLTSVWADGLAMDQAQFEFRMKLDPFSNHPTFHLATRVLGLDVTKINDLALTYGQFDFKRGLFDLVIEVDASEGQMSGYVKPLFRNLQIFDVAQDLKTDSNPLQYFWQALLGAVTAVLKNQQRDQFGTNIPLTGDISQPNADLLSTVGNVLRNGFIRAYLPKLENNASGMDGLQFGPPTIADPISVGDQQ